MIRIRGIVKTANRVKSKLQQGVHPDEVDSLKKFVFDSLQTIDKLCEEAKTSSKRLPVRSRRAYDYLKNIDWQNLPVTNQKQEEEEPATSNSSTLRIKNLIKKQKNLQRRIRELPPNYKVTQLKSIGKALSDYTLQVEGICQQSRVTPAALTAPSRKAYAWMKFLSDENYLDLHLKTVGKIKNLAAQTIKTERLNISEVKVNITNYNGLYKYRKNHQGNIELQLSEGFIQAEDNVLQAIINLILVGKNPQDKQLIRSFGLTEEYRDILLELDLIAEVDAEKDRESYYDLEELFHRLNREYFTGKLAKPRLSWNKILTQRKLGHYEPLRDRVVMSRTLDNPQVPQMVVELVLYHELLHKYHGVKWVNGKRMVHTPEFRRSERKF
ncbi:SprT-like domain-containing protein [Myxosarcina sp. GI1]|uniref:SprT-like domain-containing protein n=1 Tax=Myxosarcina sp. GI1 TaxID=1541065 RepID=UPI0006906159|nr:SprT-like domain-containing protein [Myxosarcina sp. GI1]